MHKFSRNFLLLIFISLLSFHTQPSLLCFAINQTYDSNATTTLNHLQPELFVNKQRKSFSGLEKPKLSLHWHRDKSNYESLLTRAHEQDVKIDVCAILNDTTGTLMSCGWKNHNCKIGAIVGMTKHTFPVFLTFYRLSRCASEL